MNAGQTCVAPDTLLVVGQPLEPVRAALRRAHRRHFADGLPTAVISADHLERLQRQMAGIELEPLGLDREAGLLLALDPPPTSAALAEEVFGPILPVNSVPSLDAALGWIAERPAALAVYLYTRDRRSEQLVLDRTRAGSLVVNDALVQAAMDTLPFGRVGASASAAITAVPASPPSPTSAFSCGRASNLARLLDSPYNAASSRCSRDFSAAYRAPGGARSAKQVPTATPVAAR